MAEKTDDAVAAAPKKKKKGKLILFVGLPVLLLGGGGGAAAYGLKAGWFNAAAHGSADADEPKLVPKSEEKRASLPAAAKAAMAAARKPPRSHGGLETPEGEGGDKYASNYYPLEKEFTSNLQDSVHFIQVGIAVSTPYDERVLENIKTHEIAIRSADADVARRNDRGRGLHRRGQGNPEPAGQGDQRRSEAKRRIRRR
jgi:flagellar FliL protein